MAKSQEREMSQGVDLLAAVVLHALVTGGAEGLTCEQVARACERDPDDVADATEVEQALETLVEDGLAARDGARDGGLYRPTRAALRAAELSF